MPGNVGSTEAQPFPLWALVQIPPLLWVSNPASVAWRGHCLLDSPHRLRCGLNECVSVSDGDEDGGSSSLQEGHWCPSLVLLSQ